MIIEQITLSNWLSYPAKWQQNGNLIQPTLRFDQEQAYLIFGKNGAGKSSIMEAILFALFGHYSRAAERQDIKREGAIRTGETTAIIELIFKLNGNRHKVRRVLTQSTTKAEYSIWDGKGQKWLLDTAQVTTVNAKIITLLGLNQDLFCGTVILEQGKTSRFMELKPGEQVDHVKNLLGLNIYSSYYEKAKELANQRKSEIRRLEDELKGLTDVSEATVENAEKEAKRLAKSLERVDRNVRSLEQLLTKVLIVEGIRSELATITQKIAGFETQLAQKEEIEKAAQVISNWEELQHIIKEIRGAQRQLVDQQNRINGLQDELTGKEIARLESQNNLDKKYRLDHQKTESALEKSILS
jgi:DNA repair protein SbcC/Rad50